MTQLDDKQRYEEACGLYRQSRYPEALAILNELLQKHPDSPPLLKAKAQCLEKMNEAGKRSQAVRAEHAQAPRKKSRMIWVATGASVVILVAAGAVISTLGGRDGQREKAPTVGQTASTQETEAETPDPVSVSEPLMTTVSESPDLQVQNSTPRIVLPAPAILIDEPFDLDREVARVMLDPRYPDPDREPQFDRANYQAVIDAAREARLNGEKTLITGVPENPTGKTEFRIRYLSNIRPGSTEETVWGDDEDIVIIPGFLHYKKEQILTILPGTIVLFAARYREDRKGAMQEETEEFIADAWARILDDYTYQLSDPEIEPIISSPAFTDYLSWALVDGNLMARGNRNNPILICSDASAPTPWDFQVFDAATGVLDYAVIRNCTNFELKMAENLAARSTFVTLATSLSGNGYRLANHFGLSGNESIFTFRTNQPWFEGDFAFRHVCRYNLFDNRLMCGIGLNYLRNGNQHHVVEHNRILTGYPPVQYDVPEEDLYTENVTIRYNDFLGAVGDTYLRTMTNSTLDATHNYWGTDHPSEVEKHIHHRPRIAGQGEVLYEPIRTSPDSDLDGLTDGEEQEHGTDPAAMDTDGDCCIDGLEVNEYKTDPLRFDTDGDGIPDGLEVYIKTNPLDGEDFTPIGESGDLFYDHIQIVDAASGGEKDLPLTSPSSEPTATSENPKWPGLGLPADFQGTRVGIDYSEYLTDEPFDVEKEVERVLTEVRAGKGVPPVLDKSSPYHALWHRDVYQRIIDAAREALHKHRDPRTGAPGVKSETINVPGNVTGKDTLRILYKANDPGSIDAIWGDEYDIIYITGSRDTLNLGPIDHIRIMPGTIFLVAAMQDATEGGIIPPSLEKHLREVFHPNMQHDSEIVASVQGKDKEYFTFVHFDPVVLASGKLEAPIVFFSDSAEPTPFDYTQVQTWSGTWDYVISEDSVLGGLSDVVSRCKLHRHLATGLGGPGHYLANYFGDAWNENLCMVNSDSRLSYCVRYNIFNNSANVTRLLIGGVSLDDTRSDQIEIANNVFFGTALTFLQEYSLSDTSHVAIGHNSFLAKTTPAQHCLFGFTSLKTAKVLAPNNYWGTTSASEIEALIHDGQDNPSYGEVEFRPFLASPVPMPFVTGIPEIDAVYEGPSSN